ncbi:MAG: S9 family peptidase [Vicinamibacterales bacterium]
MEPPRVVRGYNARMFSMPLRSIVALALVAIATPAAQEPPKQLTTIVVRGIDAGNSQNVTVDALMGLRTIVDAKISPAGDRVAYVVSRPSVEHNAHETALYVISVSGGTPTRVAADATMFVPALPAPRLKWLPDGQTVSFLALGEGGRPQVFTASIAGGPAQAETKAAEGVSGYDWSPDGTRLAFLTRDSAATAVATHVGAAAPATRLMVQAAANPSATPRLLTPPAQYVDSFSWAPDGRQIAYSWSAQTGFLAPYFSKIYIVPSNGGAATPIVSRAGMNVTPQFSPDGQWISFVTTQGRTDIIAPRGFAVAPASGDESKIKAFSMNGAWIADSVWARDGQSVFLTMNEGTFATGAEMFEMPVVRLTIADGKAMRAAKGRKTADYSMSLSRDGRTLAYRAVEARSMGELTLLDVVTGTTRTIVDVNPELKTWALGELKPVSWKSFDGMPIWGLLLTPPQYKAGQRVPLIVYCHGGPIGGVTYGIFPQFMHVPGQIDPYPTEAFAGAGYAVLFPMPRGGSGYGEAGHKMIINDWGGPDYQDIMAGVDYVIAQGVADPGRLGVMGASYGGFMTNWIVTQTSRFKAASAGASIADLSDLYYLTDGGDLMVEYFKKPWENPQGYAQHSPLTHAAKVTTPLLIQHGDRDPRVPLATAQKFFRALTVLGKTVEMDIYPRGGHVFYEPAQERAVMQRNFDWFKRWIP